MDFSSCTFNILISFPCIIVYNLIIRLKEGLLITLYIKNAGFRVCISTCFFLTSASPLRKPPFLYSRTSYIQVPLGDMLKQLAKNSIFCDIVIFFLFFNTNKFSIIDFSGNPCATTSHSIIQNQIAFV